MLCGWYSLQDQKRLREQVMKLTPIIVAKDLGESDRLARYKVERPSLSQHKDKGNCIHCIDPKCILIEEFISDKDGEVPESIGTVGFELRHGRDVILQVTENTAAESARKA